MLQELTTSSFIIRSTSDRISCASRASCSVDSTGRRHSETAGMPCVNASGQGAAAGAAPSAHSQRPAYARQAGELEHPLGVQKQARAHLELSIMLPCQRQHLS